MKEERFTLSLSKGYNILEACRHHPVEHLVYASSSSVYGGNKKVPFSTDDRVDNRRTKREQYQAAA